MTIEREGDYWRLRTTAQNCIKAIEYEGQSVSVPVLPHKQRREVVTDWISKGATVEQVQGVINLAFAEASGAEHQAD